MVASILMADDMARGLQARGLTRTRATALWEMARHDALNQRQIADLLHVTPRNVTKLVDALEEGGFVTRAGQPGDRRAVLVRLTRKGRAAVARMESEADAFAKQLFGDLPPVDRATVVRALNQVITRLGGAEPR